MNPTQRREPFGAILAGDRCVHPASVFEPISARIAEDLGFEVAFMAGSIASATVLGAPDLVVLTLTEFAEQIRRICRAANISLVVDADHGYGNALNVKRTVEELETAGLAGLTIEDTVLPQRFGTAKGEELIALEEGVGKMKAHAHQAKDSGGSPVALCGSHTQHNAPERRLPDDDDTTGSPCHARDFDDHR